MKEALWVFIGGGGGSVLRYWMSLKWHNKESFLPMGTLGANLLSCLILGVLMARFTQAPGPEKLWFIALGAGFCGGFSTFSTFALEYVELIIKGPAWVGWGYMFLTLLSGALALLAGFKLGSAAVA